jgi:glycosyltransferase involved in cell wall biosynthesis
VRIALFITSLHTGGSQRQIVELVRALAASGQDVSLITVYPGGQLWNEATRLQDIQLLSLYSRRPATRIGRALGVLGAPLGLRQITRALRFHVVYSMLDLSNLIARLALLGIRNGPTLAWGLRSSTRQADPRAVLPYALCRMLSGGVPLAIGNSHSSVKAYRDAGFRFPDAHVVHNGIDTDRFRFDAALRDQWRANLDVADDGILVTLVGRIDGRKGHSDFITMAQLLAERDARYRFACVGPGSAKSSRALERAIEKAGIEARMTVLGETEDMPGVYSASDIVVSASYSESFPNVVAEAMACSRPVVATDVGDAAIVVGVCGTMVAAGDTLALAHAVAKAASEVVTMHDAARQRVVENFSVEALADRTRDVLFNALGTGKGAE